MEELFLFAISIALGVSLGLLYAVLSFVSSITKLKFVRFVLDAIFSVIAVSSFAILTILFCFGQFFAYMVIGTILGIVLFYLFMTIVSDKIGIMRNNKNAKKSVDKSLD